MCVSVSLRFDQESSPENRLYLDCFCVVARGIGVSHDYITMVMLVSLGTYGWSMVAHQQNFMFGPWTMIVSCDQGTIFLICN